LEKRRHRRYSKRFKIRFGEKLLTNNGFSGDVSATGMFVVTASGPKIGTRLHLEVTLDQERVLYFEVIVARLALVAPELRQVMKGGFGVRFLTPSEIVAEMVPHLKDPGRLQAAFPTQQSLLDSWERELKRGGMFLWSERQQQLNTIVTVEIDIPFAGRTLAFEARVVHVNPEAGRFGLGLMFLDPGAASAAFSSILGIS
jgi:Tfp pilus assembly protein PilZ